MTDYAHPPVDQQPTQRLPAVPEDDLWPVQARSGTIRLRVPTVVLLVLLIAGVSLWGGVLLEKHHRSSSSAATPSFAGFPGARSTTGNRTGSFPGSGAGSATGAPGAGFTAGTVTLLRGNTLWLTSSTGALIKVKLSGATTVTRNANSSKAKLMPGDTVIVRGSTTKGVVAASSVAATAKGVSSGFGAGGFGGLGGGNTTGG